MYDEQNQNVDNVRIDNSEVDSTAQKPRYQEVISSVCDFLLDDPDYQILNLSVSNPRVFGIIVDFINLCYYLRSGNKL